MVKNKANSGAVMGTERYPVGSNIPKVSTPKAPANGLYGYVGDTVRTPNQASDSQSLPLFNVSEGFSNPGDGPGTVGAGPTSLPQQ